MMATSATAVTDRIGDLLVREGLISPVQLNAALQDARQHNTRIGYSLIKLGFVPEADLTRMLARQYRVPAVDLERVNVDPKIIKLISAELASKHVVMPLRRVGRTLTLAMANPIDVAAIDAIKFATRMEIEPVVVGEYTLRGHLQRYYPEDERIDVIEEREQSNLTAILSQIESDEDLEVIEEHDEEINLAQMQAAVEDAPVVKLINGLLTDAVLKGASDIHIEPFEKEIRVRYRIDGALHEVMKPPLKMKAALTSRLKILSALNIAERRVPQDGRIKLKMKKKVVDFRVSTLPVLFGEKIVLRILDKGNLTFDLTQFGFEPKALKDFMAGIMNPYGMVLVTGPTGSGKT
ncbi:MAG TPA: ATPase, T2SS/T4P/T4SS family, partial [Longimicrobiales bacterium]